MSSNTRYFYIILTYEVHTVGKMFVIGISKKRNNGGKRRRNWNQKRSRFIYFYDENNKFASKRITWYQALWIQATKRKVTIIKNV